MIGDQKALHLLAEHNCWNCIFCQDMQLTEIEVDDFLCLRENYHDLNEDLICEHWKEK